MQAFRVLFYDHIWRFLRLSKLLLILSLYAKIRQQVAEIENIVLMCLNVYFRVDVRFGFPRLSTCKSYEFQRARSVFKCFWVVGSDGGTL